MNATSRLFALLAVPSLFTGCATKVLMPPDHDLRSNLGAVCVVADSNVTRIRYQVPDSKADIAAERLSSDASEYGAAVRESVRAFGPRFASVGLAGAIVMVGGAPVWHGMRQGIGRLVADSADQVSAARASMSAAVAGVRFEQELRDRLAAELAARAPNLPQTESPRQAHTILELMVYEPAITGNEGINPRLALRFGLRVRLLDARTRGELYYDYLEYCSSSHTLVKWAAEDAKIFRAEIERCLANLSGEVIAQLFLRSSNETVTRGTLASNGISRRPPQPLSASAALVARSAPPIYNPPVYAYQHRR